MFQGTSLLTLDAKGRVMVPARHREALASACSGQVTLTRHPDGCVLIYPRAAWEEKRRQLAVLPFGARVLQRIVLGSAVDLEIDSSGRLLVPGELRSLCGLGREVALVGLGSHFELWDAAKLKAAEEAEMAKGLPEAAAGFAF